MLYYPTFYEGLEQSKNVIYTGQEATQQIIAGLNWINKEKGAKTFFLLVPTTSGRARPTRSPGSTSRNVLKGKVVGEEYYPLGNTQFHSVINKIKLDQARRASTRSSSADRTSPSTSSSRRPVSTCRSRRC